MKYLLATVIVVLAVITVLKIKRFNSTKSNNEIDSLLILLTPLKAGIPKETVIGYADNHTGDRSAELHFKTAFICAPIVVAKAQNDTMLILNDDHHFPEIPRHFQLIKKSISGRYQASLVRRVR